jgi:hypothetical protein
MSPDAKLILKRSSRVERWELQERGDYDLDRLGEEFRNRLYSELGREMLPAQATGPSLRGCDQNE